MRFLSHADAGQRRPHRHLHRRPPRPPASSAAPVTCAVGRPGHLHFGSQRLGRLRAHELGARSRNGVRPLMRQVWKRTPESRSPYWYLDDWYLDDWYLDDWYLDDDTHGRAIVRWQRSRTRSSIALVRLHGLGRAPLLLLTRPDALLHPECLASYQRVLVSIGRDGPPGRVENKNGEASDQ